MSYLWSNHIENPQCFSKNYLTCPKNPKKKHMTLKTPNIVLRMFSHDSVLPSTNDLTRPFKSPRLSYEWQHDPKTLQTDARMVTWPWKPPKVVLRMVLTPLYSPLWEEAIHQRRALELARIKPYTITIIKSNYFRAIILICVIISIYGRHVLYRLFHKEKLNMLAIFSWEEFIVLWLLQKHFVARDFVLCVLW